MGLVLLNAYHILTRVDAGRRHKIAGWLYRFDRTAFNIDNICTEYIS